MNLRKISSTGIADALHSVAFANAEFVFFSFVVVVIVAEKTKINCS